MREELEQTRDHDPRPSMRERAAALLKISAGNSANAVAQHGLLKEREPDTVYAWLDRYEAAGLLGLVQRPRRATTHSTLSRNRIYGSISMDLQANISIIPAGGVWL